MKTRARSPSFSCSATPTWWMVETRERLRPRGPHPAAAAVNVTSETETSDADADSDGDELQPLSPRPRTRREVHDKLDATYGPRSAAWLEAMCSFLRAVDRKERAHAVEWLTAKLRRSPSDLVRRLEQNGTLARLFESVLRAAKSACACEDDRSSDPNASAALLSDALQTLCAISAGMASEGPIAAGGGEFKRVSHFAVRLLAPGRPSEVREACLRLLDELLNSNRATAAELEAAPSYALCPLLVACVVTRCTESPECVLALRVLSRLANDEGAAKVLAGVRAPAGGPILLRRAEAVLGTILAPRERGKPEISGPHIDVVQGCVSLLANLSESHAVARRMEFLRSAKHIQAAMELHPRLTELAKKGKGCGFSSCVDELAEHALQWAANLARFGVVLDASLNDSAMAFAARFLSEDRAVAGPRLCLLAAALRAVCAFLQPARCTPTFIRGALKNLGDILRSKSVKDSDAEQASLAVGWLARIMQASGSVDPPTWGFLPTAFVPAIRCRDKAQAGYRVVIEAAEGIARSGKAEMTRWLSGEIEFEDGGVESCESALRSAADGGDDLAERALRAVEGRPAPAVDAPEEGSSLDEWLEKGEAGDDADDVKVMDSQESTAETPAPHELEEGEIECAPLGTSTSMGDRPRGSAKRPRRLQADGSPRSSGSEEAGVAELGREKRRGGRRPRRRLRRLREPSGDSASSEASAPERRGEASRPPSAEARGLPPRRRDSARFSGLAREWKADPSDTDRTPSPKTSGAQPGAGPARSFSSRFSPTQDAAPLPAPPSRCPSVVAPSAESIRAPRGQFEYDQPLPEEARKKRGSAAFSMMRRAEAAMTNGAESKRQAAALYVEACLLFLENVYWLECLAVARRGRAVAADASTMVSAVQCYLNTSKHFGSTAELAASLPDRRLAVFCRKGEAVVLGRAAALLRQTERLAAGPQHVKSALEAWEQAAGLMHSMHQESSARTRPVLDLRLAALLRNYEVVHPLDALMQMRAVVPGLLEQTEGAEEGVEEGGKGARAAEIPSSGQKPEPIDLDAEDPGPSLARAPSGQKPELIDLDAEDATLDPGAAPGAAASETIIEEDEVEPGTVAEGPSEAPVEAETIAACASEPIIEEETVESGTVAAVAPGAGSGSPLAAESTSQVKEEPWPGATSSSSSSPTSARAPRWQFDYDPPLPEDDVARMRTKAVETQRRADSVIKHRERRLEGVGVYVEAALVFFENSYWKECAWHASGQSSGNAASVASGYLFVASLFATRASAARSRAARSRADRRLAALCRKAEAAARARGAVLRWRARESEKALSEDDAARSAWAEAEQILAEPAVGSDANLAALLSEYETAHPLDAVQEIARCVDRLLEAARHERLAPSPRPAPTTSEAARKRPGPAQRRRGRFWYDPPLSEQEVARIQGAAIISSFVAGILLKKGKDGLSIRMYVNAGLKCFELGYRRECAEFATATISGGGFDTGPAVKSYWDAAARMRKARSATMSLRGATTSLHPAARRIFAFCLKAESTAFARAAALRRHHERDGALRRACAPLEGRASRAWEKALFVTRHSDQVSGPRALADMHVYTLLLDVKTAHPLDALKQLDDARPLLLSPEELRAMCRRRARPPTPPALQHPPAARQPPAAPRPAASAPMQPAASASLEPQPPAARDSPPSSATAAPPAPPSRTRQPQFEYDPRPSDKELSGMRARAVETERQADALFRGGRELDALVLQFEACIMLLEVAYGKECMENDEDGQASPRPGGSSGDDYATAASYLAHSVFTLSKGKHPHSRLFCVLFLKAEAAVRVRASICFNRIRRRALEFQERHKANDAWEKAAQNLQAFKRGRASAATSFSFLGPVLLADYLTIHPRDAIEELRGAFSRLLATPVSARLPPPAPRVDPPVLPQPPPSAGAAAAAASRAPTYPQPPPPAPRSQVPRPPQPSPAKVAPAQSQASAELEQWTILHQKAFEMEAQAEAASQAGNKVGAVCHYVEAGIEFFGLATHWEGVQDDRRLEATCQCYSKSCAAFLKAAHTSMCMEPNAREPDMTAFCWKARAAALTRFSLNCRRAIDSPTCDDVKKASAKKALQNARNLQWELDQTFAEAFLKSYRLMPPKEALEEMRGTFPKLRDALEKRHREVSAAAAAARGQMPARASQTSSLITPLSGHAAPAAPVPPATSARPPPGPGEFRPSRPLVGQFANQIPPAAPVPSATTLPPLPGGASSSACHPHPAPSIPLARRLSGSSGAAATQPSAESSSAGRAAGARPAPLDPSAEATATLLPTPLALSEALLDPPQPPPAPLAPSGPPRPGPPQPHGARDAAAGAAAAGFPLQPQPPPAPPASSPRPPPPIALPEPYGAGDAASARPYGAQPSVQSSPEAPQASKRGAPDESDSGLEPPQQRPRLAPTDPPPSAASLPCASADSLPPLAAPTEAASPPAAASPTTDAASAAAPGDTGAEGTLKRAWKAEHVLRFVMEGQPDLPESDADALLAAQLSGARLVSVARRATEEGRTLAAAVAERVPGLSPEGADAANYELCRLVGAYLVGGGESWPGLARFLELNY